MTEERTTPDSTDPVDVRAVVAAAHDATRTALDDPEQHGTTAVAWCSAHLAGADAVLYAEALRRVHDAPGLFQAVRRADHSLQMAVQRLDRRLTGDVHLDRTPVEEVAAEVLNRLEDHARAEDRVVTVLTEVLSSQELDALGPRLVAATAQGPTRPHPHTPHTPFASLVSRLDALADRVRDAMDNRVAAIGRPVRPPRPLGRWGRYLMGAPLLPRSSSDHRSHPEQ